MPGRRVGRASPCVFIQVVAVCSLLTLATGSARGAGPRGDYLGQPPPGTTPAVFAPGFVSTDAHEFACSFTPDGREFYFTRRDPQRGFPCIMVTRCADGTWSEPIVAAFAGEQPAFEPQVTPDGRRLYYTRMLPGQAGGPPGMELWVVERDGDGWGGARDAGPQFNPMKAMFATTTLDGTLYTTDVSQGPGTEGIAVSRLADGQYQPLARLGPPINTGTNDMYPCIAPDGSRLVFCSQRPGVSAGKGLMVARRQADGAWSEPRPVELGMAAGTPHVSPDGRYLFFTGGERGKGDIYWVSAAVLDEAPPAAGR